MRTHTKRLMAQSAALLAGLAVAGVALGWRAASPRFERLGDPAALGGR